MYYVDLKGPDGLTLETVTARDRDEVEWLKTGLDLLDFMGTPAWDLEVAIADARLFTTDESVLDFFTRLGSACTKHPDAVVDVLY